MLRLPISAQLYLNSQEHDYTGSLKRKQEKDILPNPIIQIRISEYFVFRYELHRYI